VHGNVNDRALIQQLLAQHRPRAVVHLAAESHVDRSIRTPEPFIQSNIVGTFNLLEEIKDYWASLEHPARANFRFLHVSTDEVYGSLESGAAPFTESSPCLPSSPYAASKASSDLLVRAYHRTYGLPTLVTRCCNNYGPHQFPEKLIPVVILKALAEQQVPVYGDGMQVRDWLFVDDHCAALLAVLDRGLPGSVYNIGANCERTNVGVMTVLCDLLDHLRPRTNRRRHRELLTPVGDRPGHDRRYALDAGRARTELGWRPAVDLDQGLQRTLAWYLAHAARLGPLLAATPSQLGPSTHGPAV
jgi:dTDP-glucose 4,6-dehydratase